MPPEAPLLHFAVSCAAVLAAGSFIGLLRRDCGVFLAAAGGVLAAIALGELKEVRDLLENPWSLSPAALRADSASDMGWNLVGAVAGAAILIAVALAARTVRALLSRLSRVQVEGLRRGRVQSAA
jgi:hypothetical protein